MQSGVKRTVISLACIVALVVGAVFYRVMRTPELDSRQLYQLGAVMRDEPSTVAPFRLLDQDGNDFANQQLLGKWSLVFFGYTFCPDICPVTMSKLATLNANLQAEADIADQLQYLMVTVDPARDTPPRLKQYVAYFNPDFIGLAGELQDLHDFALGLNAIFAKVPIDEEGNYLMDHSGNIVLLNPRGEYVGFFKAPHAPANMARALQSIIGRG